MSLASKRKLRNVLVASGLAALLTGATGCVMLGPSPPMFVTGGASVSGKIVSESYHSLSSGQLSEDFLNAKSIADFVKGVPNNPNGDLLQEAYTFTLKDEDGILRRFKVYTFGNAPDPNVRRLDDAIDVSNIVEVSNLDTSQLEGMSSNYAQANYSISVEPSQVEVEK